MNIIGQKHPQGVRQRIPGSFAATLPQTGDIGSNSIAQSKVKYRRVRHAHHGAWNAPYNNVALNKNWPNRLDVPSRMVIPEHLMLSRLAQSEQMRELFIQMWLQNPMLAKQGGSKVQNLLPPLAVANAEESSNPNFPGSVMGKMQRGFSLVSAIFLLVVIAALGTFAVTLSTTQQQSSAMDVMGARAYQAARAGIEWGTYQALRNAGACAVTTTLPALPGTLNGFTVIVTCTPTAFVENGIPGNSFLLVSNANAKQGTAGTPSYVEREIRAIISPP